MIGLARHSIETAAASFDSDKEPDTDEENFQEQQNACTDSE